MALLDGDEAWLVVRHADVRQVLADRRFSRAAAFGEGAPRLVGGDPLLPAAILNMDPPEHTRLRKIAAGMFTAHRMERLRPRIRQTATDLIEAMAAGGPPTDLMAAFALALPVLTICELLGVPYGDRDRFRTWTDVSAALTEAEVVEVVQALKAYMAELISVNRHEPTDSVLGALVTAHDDHGQLSKEELVTFGVFLLVAGHETTARQIGNGIVILLRQPNQWSRLAREPALVPRAVEELLRFTPFGVPVADVRIATEDVELTEMTVQAGEAVLASIVAADRDATVFVAPDRLNLDRAENPHVAFGHGIHHCLGASLARVELQETFTVLPRAFPNLRLAVPEQQLTWMGMFNRRSSTLPVTW
ncbi:MAG: cytochrome P450 [Egibacteraceae bacterium]